MKSHLFLQGPHGCFFKSLGLALSANGDKVIRVNCCGGDVVDWPYPYARNFRGEAYLWSIYISKLMDEEGITDLHVFGDWRPLHREAVLLAKLRGIRVWAYDEGYLRPNYITMEKDGVNGLSLLPKTRDALYALASACRKAAEPLKLGNPQKPKTYRAICHYAGALLLFPLFPHFKTHRPQSAFLEAWGWSLKILRRQRRFKRSAAAVRQVYAAKAPYFLFPLQLDTDSQVRRYSPYSGMKEAIACVLTSFALNAPGDTHLVIRNHPLDNGLIDYARYIDAFAAACSLKGRVHFIEGGKARKLMDNSLGVVVLNSTMGISALECGKAVYCVGTAIYAMRGLAVKSDEMPLDEFWLRPRPPDQDTLSRFELVLKNKALVNGNFYTAAGVKAAVSGVIERLRGL